MSEKLKPIIPSLDLDLDEIESSITVTEPVVRESPSIIMDILREQQEENKTGYGADIFRSVLDTSQDIAATALDIPNIVVEQFAVPPAGEDGEFMSDEEFTEWQNSLKIIDPEKAVGLSTQVMSQLAGDIPVVGKDIQQFIEANVDENFLAKERETIPGFATDVATYLATMNRTGVGPTAATRGITGSLVAEQIYHGQASDPTLMDIAVESFPTFFTGQEEESRNILQQYFASATESREETVSKRRLNNLVENALLEGTFATLLPALGFTKNGMISISKYVRGKFGKPINELDQPEQLELFDDVITNIKKLGSSEEEVVTPPLRSATIDMFGDTHTPDIEGGTRALSQTLQPTNNIFENISAIVSRTKNLFFSSRGSLSERAKALEEMSLNFAKADSARAVNIANSLKNAIDTAFTRSNEQAGIRERIMSALEDDLNLIYDSDREGAILDLTEKFGIPPEVAEPIYEARMLLDDLSKQLINSNYVAPELKEILSENMGAYIRRSYRAYTDAGYVDQTLKQLDETNINKKPQVILEAENYMYRQVAEANPNFSPAEIEAQAKANLKEIILGAEGNMTYFTTMRRVNDKVMNARQEIPEEIRNLLGEIREPESALVLSITQASNYLRNMEYLGRVKDMAQDQYLFNQPVGPFATKIQGTGGSPIEGMYTTPEVARALRGTEDRWFDRARHEYNMYDRFLQLKGFSQAAKTVGSHTTHIRNFIGATQFAIRNGLNPFESPVESFKLLKNNITAGGDTTLNETYNRFLELGLVSSSVRANEFLKLMDVGVSGGFDVNTRVLDKIGSAIQDSTPAKVYTATDDFFKISGYLQELDTLKQAYPDRPIAELETEAAEIVKNTFPTYNRVPPGIKRLRSAPIGNFIAFPAEVMRTSTNIIVQAAKELKSGNPVVVERGQRRLGAFLVTGAPIWEGASTMSGEAAGFTAQQERNASILTETPYSKESPRMWKLDEEDGRIYYLDTQFLNSYDYIQQPLMAVANRLLNNDISAEDLNKELANIAATAVIKLVEPFAGESMLTEKVLDAAALATDWNAGRGIDGKVLIPSSATTSEKIAHGVYNLVELAIPQSVIDITKSVVNEPNPYTAQQLTNSQILLNNIGLRWIEFRPEDSFSLAITQYNSDVKESNNESNKVLYDNTGTPEEIAQQYIRKQFSVYEAQQQLFRKYNAFVNLFGTRIDGEREAGRILRDKNYGKERTAELADGVFRPESVENILDVIVEKDKETKQLLGGWTIEKISETKKALVNARNLLTTVPLDSIDVAMELRFPYEFEKLSELEPGTDAYRKQEAEIEKRRSRFQEQYPSFAIGGEVYDVPQAPVEPDERIDKMTGLPYNQQAGGAFIDSEERFGFSTGSIVKGVFNTIKKYSKKNVSDEAAEAAAKRIADMYTPEELADPRIQEFTELNTRVLLDEKHDMTLDQMREQGWQGPIEGDDFSRWRGYTQEEIDVFNRTNQLGDELPFDTQDINYEITDALDEINALDIPIDKTVSSSNQISNKEYEKAWSALDKIENMEDWKEAAKKYVSENRYSTPSARTPELEQSAKDFEQGKITRDEHLANVQKYKPVIAWDQLPREPSSKAMVYSLKTNQIKEGNFIITADEADKLNVKKSNLKVGDKFQGRLDITAYNSYDTWIVAGTSKDAGKGTHYAKAIHYVGKEGEPVTLNANANKSLKVAKGEEDKSGYAVISGWVKDLDVDNIRKTANDFFDDPEWTQIGFDNKRQGKFYVREASENGRVGDVVTAADEVIQIGPFVFAKNAQIDKAYQGFAEGGLFKSLMRRVKEKANNYAADSKGVQGKVAGMVGISPSDIEWANSLGMKYGQREEMDGRGDAARHVALGWLAQRAKHPRIAQFLVNAREVISNVPAREMDQFNNNLGFAMQAKNRAEAEERITKLIDEQQARYMTPAQSQELHGYSHGGKVMKACSK